MANHVSLCREAECGPNSSNPIEVGIVVRWFRCSVVPLMSPFDSKMMPSRPNSRWSEAFVGSTTIMMSSALERTVLEAVSRRT